MKRRIRIIIITCLICLLLFFLVYKIAFTKKNNLSKNITINEITFSNLKINKKKDKYNFEVELYTKKDNNEILSFDAIIYDKKGEVIEILTCYVGGILKDEHKIISTTTEKDLSKAYSINYTVNKE